MFICFEKMSVNLVYNNLYILKELPFINEKLHNLIYLATYILIIILMYIYFFISSLHESLNIWFIVF